MKIVPRWKVVFTFRTRPELTMWVRAESPTEARAMTAALFFSEDESDEPISTHINPRS